MKRRCELQVRKVPERCFGESDGTLTGTQLGELVSFIIILTRLWLDLAQLTLMGTTLLAMRMHLCHAERVDPRQYSHLDLEAGR